MTSNGTGQPAEDSSAIRYIETPEILFDLEQAAPQVLARASETAPWLAEELAALRKRLPVTLSAQPFRKGNWFRPANHRRAFYREQPGETILAFKGMEIVSDDSPFMVAMVAHKYDSTESPLEHFPLLEHKAPGALLLDEAMPEAQAALALQSRWVETYEGIARTPVPLLVLRWPAEVVQHYRDALFSHLSPRVSRIVERLISDGLAAYVYYYPGPPTRTTELTDRSAGLRIGYGDRKEYYAAALSFERTFHSWMQLVGRMLALGFMPVTLSHENAGYAVQMQNAVVDGGFVDMDSVQPLSAIQSPREFATTFWVMVSELAYSVGTLLRGASSRKLEKTLLVQHDAAVLSIIESLREVLREEEARGLKLDPRLREIVFEQAGFARLDKLFTLHYP